MAFGALLLRTCVYVCVYVCVSFRGVRTSTVLYAVSSACLATTQDTIKETECPASEQDCVYSRKFKSTFILWRVILSVFPDHETIKSCRYCGRPFTLRSINPSSTRLG